MFLRKRNDLELNRPIIKLDMGPADLILEILAIVSLLCFIGFTIYSVTRLPETIPTHFNASGIPDDYGSKNTLWMLPVVALILYAILSLVGKIPEKFNYPVRITTENARIQYTLRSRFLRYIKLVIVLMFFFISYQTMRITHGVADGLGMWFLPVFPGIIFVPVILYLILAKRSR